MPLVMSEAVIGAIDAALKSKAREIRGLSDGAKGDYFGGVEQAENAAFVLTAIADLLMGGSRLIIGVGEEDLKKSAIKSHVNQLVSAAEKLGFNLALEVGLREKESRKDADSL